MECLNVALQRMRFSSFCGLYFESSCEKKKRLTDSSCCLVYWIILGVSITDNASVIFGGSDKPCALGNMYSIGAIGMESNGKIQVRLSRKSLSWYLVQLRSNFCVRSLFRPP